MSPVFKNANGGVVGSAASPAFQGNTPTPWGDAVPFQPTQQYAPTEQSQPPQMTQAYSPHHPDFYPPQNTSSQFQVITYWHKPSTGEEVSMPNPGWMPREGTGWVRGRAPEKAKPIVLWDPGKAVSIPEPTTGTPLAELVSKRSPATSIGQNEQQQWRWDGNQYVFTTPEEEAARVRKSQLEELAKQQADAAKRRPPVRR